MKNSFVFIIVILCICFLQCKKEAPEEVYNCSNIELFFKRLSTESDDDRFIRDITILDLGLRIHYADGAEIRFVGDCTIETEVDENNDWIIRFHAMNIISEPLKQIGTVDIQVDKNPSPYCPLMCRVQLSVGQNVYLKTRVLGKNLSSLDFVREYPERKKQHLLDVYGLYAEHRNEIFFELYSARDVPLFSDSVQVQTAALEIEIPSIHITKAKTEKMQEGFTLVSDRVFARPSTPYMLDNEGLVRWYLSLEDHPQLFDLNYDTGIERLANGNLYMGDILTDAIYEFKWDGTVVNSWSILPYEFHHNVNEKPDGNFLVTVNDLSSTHLNGKPTEEDLIIEIDRNNGQVVKTWDLKNFMDESRTVWGANLNAATVDWAHANSVVYDPSDNSIIVSCQRQGAIKIGYDDEIKWILAPHRAWGMNRRSEDLNNFLLSPLDKSASVISDPDVLEGSTSHPDFEWSWLQHAVDIHSNGDIILFDNGHRRNFAPNEIYSRAVQYRIDEDAMTIEEIWSYGKTRGLEAFSSIVSDVDELANGNILFAPGHKVNNMNGEGAKIIEIDPLSGEVVFEAELTTDGFITFHRVERLVPGK